MNPSHEALGVERAFFAALLAADADALASILTDDFVLVEVMRGGIVPGAMLREALASAAEPIRFTAIEVMETDARVHGETVIVVGRARMRGLAHGNAWHVESRYTHLFVAQDGRWRLASAQGTPIVAG